MNFLKIRQLGSLLFIIVAMATCAHGTSVWYSASRPPLEGQPDIPVVILRYFSNTREMVTLWSDLLFGRGLQGSSIHIWKLLIPFILLPVLYIAQAIIHRKYQKTRDYTILYTSWPFVAFTCLWIILTATVNGIAQAEGWYWARWPLESGGFIEVPGSFDVATHIMANGAFIGVFLNLAFAEWFGLNKLIRRFSTKLFMCERMRSSLWFFRNLSNSCELFDCFGAATVTYRIAVWFEWIEALHPEDFGTKTNLRGNSYSDLSCVFLALMIFAFVYRLLVSRQIRTYD